MMQAKFRQYKESGLLQILFFSAAAPIMTRPWNDFTQSDYTKATVTLICGEAAQLLTVLAEKKKSIEHSSQQNEVNFGSYLTFMSC